MIGGCESRLGESVVHHKSSDFRRTDTSSLIPRKDTIEAPEEHIAASRMHLSKTYQSGRPQWVFVISQPSSYRRLDWQAWAADRPEPADADLF